MTSDYIIVGCGLAGIAFCEQLLANNKSFVVFDDTSQHSSTVAGGLYNPVILKRFSSVWKSEEQLQLALPMYARLEERFDVKLDFKVPVYRRFASVEEQNDWYAASDKPKLTNLLSTNIHSNENKQIDAHFGFGEVVGTGRVDTKVLIENYKTFLSETNRLKEETFEYDALENGKETLSYKGIIAKQIVFAEGFGMKRNPFFKDLPLKEVKGELVTIHAPNLKMDFVLKSSVFVIPIGNDLYTIGSTYDWKDKTNAITERAKEQLLRKFKTIVDCDFTIVKQVAGIRPTVKDRRPLVGRHGEYDNMYILNGLGTRGVMIGPYVAKKLYHYIEDSQVLNEEIDIKRFEK